MNRRQPGIGVTSPPRRAARPVEALAAWSLLVAAAGLCVRAGDAAPAPAEKTDFNRDIRPILADKCFKCHGPDTSQRKAKLRLDSLRDAQAPAESGSRAIVAGHVDESELIRRITSGDPEERMPPPRTGKTLSAAEIARLRSWIEEGARYDEHWAFRAPVRPEQPTAGKRGWCRNPIDSFIVARLESTGMSPSPEADKVTLIRRLSLDLIGLPPTVAEVDAYVADRRPDADLFLVDRLLASPEYGERWGRIWLDAARYADSDGYEKDKPRQVYSYRDWVIKALNRDIPYDQFIIEQIAGDQLPGATQDQVVATGFLRNSMINEEGGVDPEQFRMEAMFDRMDCIGKGVLGLTIQCCQCHNHKYDPITQEDYYRMFAFLNNAHEANVVVYTPEQQMKRSEIFRGVGEIEADLKHRSRDWHERLAAWEKHAARKQPDWSVVRPEIEDESSGGEKYRLMDDGSFLAQGYAPTKHTLKMSVKTELAGITAFRLELLNDSNLPCGGPGRSIAGSAALTEFRVDAAPANGGPSTPIKFARATADFNPPVTPLAAIFDDRSGKKRVTGPVDFAIDGKDETAWGIDAGPGRRNVPRKAVFTTQKPISFAGGTILTFHVAAKHGGWNSDDNQNNNLGRFRLSITTAADATADRLPRDVREFLSIAPERRSPAQNAAIFSYFRTTVPEWKDANARIDALWNQHPEGSTQLVMVERDSRRATHILQRGDFLKPKKAVAGAVPAFLNPLPSGAPVTRLTFAKWLVDRNSPTTARSIVNRVWQAYFGTGIVATSEDLGTQAEQPSHPELLDWLAVELMESGWRLKPLHRLIATSAVYSQASRVTPELLARDPYNRLLARGPRFRVDAEIVRDIALSASGLLDRKIGGPSVCPPAPAFLFQPPASYGPKVWNDSTGPDRYRRALYTFRYRSVPYPMLQAFDAPNGDFSCVRRTRSNTPLQALTTLNEPIFLECARALALRAVREGGTSDDDRMAYAFGCCLARAPRDQETRALFELWHQEIGRFQRPGAAPWVLAADDPKNPPELPAGVDPPQLAAWTAVARVLLNLDEAITKE
jgi:hypothetical protein